ncbi:hypothetical protein L7F22_004357 [Adiantum nelumboides]|nr:hypothetical protein [Adiantum nelumboides]
MDSQAPTSYSKMSQDNDGTPIYSQFSQNPFTPPPYAHSTFPIAPFGSSPFAFRPFQPLQPTPQHVARRSPMPNLPQGGVMSVFTDGVSKQDGTLEQSKATKLLARRKIEEVTIDGGQSTSQKRVRLKRQKKDQSNNADLDDNKEKTSRESWKDASVVQFIHIRGARHGEFGRPPKQGVDLWSKVATELASLFPECDKDGQACRKNGGEFMTHTRGIKLTTQSQGLPNLVASLFNARTLELNPWVTLVEDRHNPYYLDMVLCLMDELLLRLDRQDIIYRLEGLVGNFGEHRAKILYAMF